MFSDIESFRYGKIECLNEQHSHGNQRPFKWIENQADAPKRSRAQQRLVILFTKDHWRRTAFTLQFKIGVSDSPPDRSSVSQRKIRFPMRADAESP
jgi:hypothetical protein